MIFTCFCWFWTADWTQIFRSMTLIKNNESIKIWTTPLQQLLQSWFVFTTGRIRFADQSRIRREDDALLNVAVDRRRYFRVLEFIQGMHVDFPRAYITKIPFGVVLQIVRNRHPNRTFSPLLVILKYNSAYCTSFSDTGSITWNAKQMKPWYGLKETRNYLSGNQLCNRPVKYVRELVTRK